jgi:hypothetical protein
LTARRRPFQHPHENECKGGERREEERFGHREGRVGDPRLEHDEGGDTETPAVGQDAPRQGVSGDRGHRHGDCIHRLRCGERGGAVTCETVGRTEEEGVEDAVPEFEVAAKEGPTVERDVLRELRVEDLVPENFGFGLRANEECA